MMDLSVYEVECLKCGAKFDLPPNLSERRSGMKRVRVRRMNVFKDRFCIALERVKRGEIEAFDEQGRRIDSSTLPEPVPRRGDDIDLDEVKGVLEQIPRFGRSRIVGGKSKGKVAERGVFEFFVSNDYAEIEDIVGRGKRIKIKNPFVVGTPVEAEIEAEDVEITEMIADVNVNKDEEGKPKEITVKCPECGEVALIWRK